MTTANTPENNNNSNEAHPSLGKAPNTNYPEWVVVENAGGTENGFDIMKRQIDGTLTTEF